MYLSKDIQESINKSQKDLFDFGVSIIEISDKGDGINLKYVDPISPKGQRVIHKQEENE